MRFISKGFLRRGC